jgi:microcystin-dependent protein
MAASKLTGALPAISGANLTGVQPFPTGTLMLFQQTSAPSGWTKSTTHNNKALRVVSGTAGSGGSSAFTTAFGAPSVAGTVNVNGDPTAGNLSVSMSGSVSVANTTLSTNQIPAHSHGSFVGSGYGNNSYKKPASWYNSGNSTFNTYNTGGNGAHNHSASHNLSGSMSGNPAKGNLTGALSSATAGINVQYVDLIIAAKD